MNEEIKEKVNHLIGTSDNLISVYGDTIYYHEALEIIIEALNCRVEALLSGVEI